MNFFFPPTQAMVDESYDISTAVDGGGGIHGYIFIAVGSCKEETTKSLNSSR